MPLNCAYVYRLRTGDASETRKFLAVPPNFPDIFGVISFQIYWKRLSRQLNERDWTERWIGEGERNMKDPMNCEVVQGCSFMARGSTFD